MNSKNDRAINFIRFFFLGLAIALMILLGVLLFSVYRSSTREITDSDLVIVDDTEAITQAETEVQTEVQTEIQTEVQTEMNAGSGTETESLTETDAVSGTDADSDSAAAAETSEQTADDTAAVSTGQTSSDTSSEASAVQSVDGDVVTIEEETTASEDTSSESTGVYSTLNAACNFRSEAGYEDADGNDTTISVCQAGTQVEVLEAAGGWTKVRIDGVVGYVGAQFVGESEEDAE